MPVIGMIGPHAVGKTTALIRWARRYESKLVTVSLDAERSKYPGNDEKAKLIVDARNDPRIWVVESARGFAAWLSAFLPTEPVIVLWTPPKVARVWWGDRREAKGKDRDLGAYWDDRRLGYECESYMKNWAKKLPGSKLFEVTDRERDWATVDDYFYQLFRTLHNARKK